MKTIINEELIGAFLEGRTTAEESVAILRMAERDENLRQLLDGVMAVDDADEDVMPYGAVAAETNDRGNRCAVICEQRVLRQFGIDKTVDVLEQRAVENGWLIDGGMPIENLGCLAESEGLRAKRSFHNKVDNLKQMLADGYGVIVVVDAAETCGECNDAENGYTPNHAVVVTDVTNDDVTFYDPDYDRMRSLSHAAFDEAWNDSAGYMVACCHEK